MSWERETKQDGWWLKEGSEYQLWTPNIWLRFHRVEFHPGYRPRHEPDRIALYVRQRWPPDEIHVGQVHVDTAPSRILERLKEIAATD